MRMARLTAVLSLLAGALALAACGSPPREFRDVADAPEVLVDLPASPAGDAGADAGADAGTAATDDLGGGVIPIAVGLAAVPAMPIAQLLGKTRSEIETLLRPVGADDDERAAGWVRYSSHLRVRYDRETAVELVQRVPAGLPCAEAAKWIGFGAAGAAAETADRCTWDGKAASLADGVSGEVDRAGCLLTAHRPLPAGE